MLPIYTRFLSPEHYGTLELLSMVLDVTGILFGLRLAEGVFRYYYQYDDPEDRKQVVFTSLTLAFAMNALGVIVLMVSAGPVAMWGFGDSEAASLIRLFSLVLLLDGLGEMCLTFVRARQRPWLYVGFSVLKLIVQLSLNIYFVVVLRMTVRGVILSSLISALVIIVPLLWYALSHTGLALSWTKARQLTSFSLPLIVTSLISFYMTFGDRYFLRVFGGGLDEVGVYALGYRFGFLLSFLVGDPFFSIWDSEKYQAFRQPDRLQRFRQAFLMLTAGMAVVTAGLCIYIEDFLRVMAAPAFWQAAAVVPIVLAAYVCQNFAAFANFGLLQDRRTGEIAQGTAISAVVVTIGYLTLIPALGGVGAALATLLAFAVRAAWLGWRANRRHPLHLPWIRAFRMMFAVAIAWTLSLYAPEALIPSIAVHTTILVAFLSALVLLPGLLPRDIRQGIQAMIRERRLRFS